jgi:hypothetical protein
MIRPGENIVAANAVATATLQATQAGRLRGIYVNAGAAEGTLTFRDGGASGTTIAVFITPAGLQGFYIDIPGGGIPFATDLHVTILNLLDITAFMALD